MRGRVGVGAGAAGTGGRFLFALVGTAAKGDAGAFVPRLRTARRNASRLVMALTWFVGGVCARATKQTDNKMKIFSFTIFWLLQVSFQSLAQFASSWPPVSFPVLFSGLSGNW